MARSASSRPATKRPPRKSTFVVRKEEKQRLEREIARLKAQWAALQAGDAAQSRPPTSRATFRDRHLAFQGLRSLVTAYMSNAQFHEPPHQIHLPLDAAARRAVLVRRSSSALNDVRKLVVERSRFLDISRPHVATEWFENEDDSMSLVQFDVTPFPSSVRIRDVYDAVGFYAQNVEIYVTERLGDLTIREDDEVDPTGAAAHAGARVSQRRVVSTTNYGITIDGNVALFRQFFHKGEHDEFPEEHAVMCTQVVESDALYPYVPAERVRHDLNGGCLIRQVTTADGQRVTSLVRASVITRHSSEGRHPIAEASREPLRVLAVQWGDLMLVAVREYLHEKAQAHSSASPPARKTTASSTSSSTSTRPAKTSSP